jgi:hypothetical protein
LEQHRPYTVTHVSRKQTSYGDSLFITVYDGVTQYCVFSPKTSSIVFTDKYYRDINQGKLSVQIIYKGICDEHSAYRLSLEIEKK